MVNDGFVLGLTEPGPGNVGPATSTTTTQSGTGSPATFTASTNGQTFERVRFECFVNVTAANVTFRDCEFVGPASFTPVVRGVVNCTSLNCLNIVFDRCRIRPQTPTRGLSGIFGHDFSALRCEISRTEDWFGFNHSAGSVLNINVHGCWGHDFLYACPNSFLSDNRTHNDGIQFHGNARNVSIVGNRFEAYIDPAVSTYAEPTFEAGQQISGYQWFSTNGAGGPGGLWGTSVMMFSPVGSILEDVTIDRNWISGGAVALNFAGWTTGTGVSITGNRWGRDQRLGEDWLILANAALPLTISGNAYADDGSPYNGRHNG